MEKQSIRIGVDKLYYALMLSDTVGEASYANPEQIQGTTEIALTLNNTVGTFYADDGAYEAFTQQGDIEFAISLAGLSQEVRARLTGAQYDPLTGLAVDGQTDSPPNVAIGFRSQKANGQYRYVWVLKGKFSKANATYSTKGSTVTPQAEQYTYKALNRIYDNNWRQMLDSDDANLPIGLNNAALSDPITGWFSSPNYRPAAPGTPISDLAAATGLTTGTIGLTFSAPAGATLIKAQVEVLGSWIDVATEASITAASTSAKIIGLTAGNTYTCRLVVVGGASNGISNSAGAAAGA